MMTPYTALCPSCNSEMDLTQKDMEKADGDVICGHCDLRFHAPDHLLKGFFSSRTGSKPKNKSVAEAHNENASKIDPMEDILTSDNTGYASYRRKKRLRIWGGLLLNGALLAVFLFQLAWVRFDDWASKENLRPVYAFLCAVRNLNCQLPAFVEPSDLVLGELRVNLREDAVYVIRGNIRNRAKFSRAFPWVEVVFFDVHNTRLASGRFSPDQYLADSVVSDTSVKGGGDADILLEVRKPLGNPDHYRMRLIAVAP